MRWTERQRAMLAEIGIRVWAPTLPEPVESAALAPRASPARALDVDARAADAGRTAALGTERASAEGLAADRIEADALGADRVDAVAARGRIGARAPSAAVRLPRSSDDDPARLAWPALEARAAACTECALCAGRTRSVFGAGHPEARWMIVGDAPDADDDRDGSPFAGRPGVLLDNMLAAIGLTRSAATADRQVYVTPAVKCRPPGQRPPEPAEAAACEPFLRRQVELVQPRLILAMGRTASQVLSGSAEPIGKLRGRLHRYGEVPVVATFHPSYLLRHPQDKADAWADLCLALETLRASGA